MNATVNEVLEFTKENDVKFVRLAFCDLLGRQKNISVIADRLEEAFTNGVSFDGSAIDGFLGSEKSDLFLFPDPSTLAVLPWRPQQGRVLRFYCDIRHPDGSDFECDCRKILKNVLAACAQKGLSCKIGAECEFYLFKTDENGEPTQIPADRGSYLDISPLDKGENVRREICLSLEDMGVSPESSHHEQGPGQNEVDFVFSDALESADNLQTFKSAVKVIAARNGLFASFLPKPLPDESGNGLHINLSLFRGGKNLLGNSRCLENAAVESFLAGILEKTPEITLFLNPTGNSYRRFGEFEAPKYISWSYRNRSQLIRIPEAAGDRRRFELRSPDPAANPYLAYALIIGAGLMGIEKNLALPAPVEENLYTAEKKVTDSLRALPGSFQEAIAAAESSSFVPAVIGASAFEKYLSIKRAEEKAYSAGENSYTLKRYFPFL